MRSLPTSLVLSCFGFSMVLATACTKGKEPEAQQDNQPPSADSSGATPVAGELPKAKVGPGNHLFAKTDLSTHIPGDVIAVGAFAGAERMFDAFGRDGVVAKLGPLYAEGTKEMVEAVGQDLLSLPGLRAAGVDPSQPIAMFLLPLADTGGAFMFGVSDRAALLATADKVAAADHQSFDKTEQDGATILCPKGETDVCLLVTADHGYLTLSESGQGLAIALTLAGLKSDASLAGNAKFGEVMATLDGGADMAGYVNLAPLMIPIMGEMGSNAPLAREVIGPFQNLAIGADIAPRSIVGQVLVQTEQPWLLGSLVRNGSQRNPVVAAMGEDAIMLSAYNLDLAAIWGLIAKVAATEGENLDEFEAGLVTLTGFGLQKDLMPALTGEVGFGVRADLDSLFAAAGQLPVAGQGDALEAQVAKAVDGALSIGLTDAGKGKALLDKAFAQPELASMVKRDEALDQWTLTAEGLPKTLFIAIATPPGVTPFVVVATEQGLLDRIREGQVAPAFSGQAKDPEYAAFIGQSDVAAIHAGRQILMGAGVWVGLLAMSGNDEAAIDVEGDTAEQAKVRKELAEVDKQLNAIQAEDGRAKMAAIRGIMRPWGATAGSLKITATGAEIRAGQFIAADSWPALTAGLVEAGQRMAAQSNDNSKSAMSCTSAATTRSEALQLRRELAVPVGRARSGRLNPGLSRQRRGRPATPGVAGPSAWPRARSPARPSRPRARPGRGRRLEAQVLDRAQPLVADLAGVPVGRDPGPSASVAYRCGSSPSHARSLCCARPRPIPISKVAHRARRPEQLVVGVTRAGSPPL